MKLPILGILIVIFLQLGFTAYNALDRPIESLVAVKAVTTGTNPIASTYNNLDDESFRSTERIENIISALNIRNNKRSPEATFISSKKPVPASRTTNIVPRFVAAQKHFESITISYPKPTNGESESDQYIARLVSKPEKRSFVAKSVSVMKKPYDWIKALGSRIN